MQKQKTVLCVEDDVDNGEILEVFFQQSGFEVLTCRTSEQCLEHIKIRDFSALVLDYHLPEKDGIDICLEVRESDAEIPIVFFTADARETIRQAALEAGADALLVKPDDLMEVVLTVESLIKKKTRSHS